MADQPTATLEPNSTVVDVPPQGEEPDVQTPEPLDPALVSRAKDYNLTEDDLRAIPRDVVDRIIAGADRKMMDAFRRSRQAADTPYAPPTTSYPQTPNSIQATGVPAYSQPQYPQQQPQFTPYELKFDPDAEIAEPIVKNLDGLNKYIADQFNKLHGQYSQKFAQYEAYVNNVTRQQDYALLDRYVENLGPEWSSVFGKGSSLEMDPRSHEFSQRDALRTAAIEVMQMHKAVTGQNLSATEALRRAQYAMFADKAFAVDRQKADAKAKAAQAAATDRTRSPGAPQAPTGIRARAAAMVRSQNPQR